ncbi:MAG: hypothetical protein AB8D52_11410 [Gammaproteobacteria bacterium]
MRVMIILLVLAIAVGAIVFMSSDKEEPQNIGSSISGDQPKSNVETAITQQGESQTDQANDASLAGEPEASEQDLRRELMLSKFSDLKELRKKTKMRVSRLSSRLRRSEFSPDQAKTISQDMRQAGYLLKNPKLLGAFSSPEEIDQEHVQLSDANIKLDSIKQALDEKKKR